MSQRFRQGDFSGNSPPFAPRIPPTSHPWPPFHPEHLELGPTGAPLLSQYPTLPPPRFHRPPAPFHRPPGPSGYAPAYPQFGPNPVGSPHRRMPQKRRRGPNSPGQWFGSPHYQHPHHWRGGKKSHSGDTSFSDEYDPYYDRSMFEDPWKDLFSAHVVLTSNTATGVCPDKNAVSESFSSSSSVEVSHEAFGWPDATTKGALTWSEESSTSCLKPT